MTGFNDPEAIRLRNFESALMSTDTTNVATSAANLAANALAVEARTLLTSKSPDMTELRNNFDSLVPGASIKHNEKGDYIEFTNPNGNTLDFYADGSSVSGGLTISRDAGGNPVRYQKEGYSYTLHNNPGDDGRWYFHNDEAGGKYVQIDTPTIELPTGKGIYPVDLDVRKGQVIGGEGHVTESGASALGKP